MAFPPAATFGQLFPFQTNQFEAKLFASLETMVVWLTRQQKIENPNDNESDGLER